MPSGSATSQPDSASSRPGAASSPTGFASPSVGSASSSVGPAGASDSAEHSPAAPPTPDVLWPEGETSATQPPRARFKLSPEQEKSLDVWITILGLFVATLLGAALALIEALYSPLRVGGVRVPVSLVMALVTNPLLAWFAYTTTRSRLAPLLPAAVWCVIWIMAADKTSEGDLIISQDNWVGLLTLIAGSVAFAIGIYKSTLRAGIAPTRAADKSTSASTPAGS
ncbi:hypothetical protein [Dactylosporangium sp. CA-233914]|uniref:hypothetical protein n=1 Tax=Dactylosporangium sp. CA-233914 TaxID=3239934 RepID=UPI003D90B1E2